MFPKTTMPFGSSIEYVNVSGSSVLLSKATEMVVNKQSEYSYGPAQTNVPLTSPSISLTTVCSSATLNAKIDSATKLFQSSIATPNNTPDQLYCTEFDQLDHREFDFLPSSIPSSRHVSQEFTESISSTNSPIDKPFKCNFGGCHKSFDTISYLKKHVKTVHSGQTFYCTTEGCNKVYKSSLALRQHISKHKLQLKGTPFECGREGCQRSFWEKVALKQHIPKVHSVLESTSSPQSLHSTSHVPHSSPKSINSLTSSKMPLTTTIEPVIEVQSLDTIASGSFITTRASMLHQHNEHLQILSLIPINNDGSFALINPTESNPDNSVVPNVTSTHVLDKISNSLSQLMHRNVQIVFNESLTSLKIPLSTTNEPVIGQLLNPIASESFSTGTLNRINQMVENSDQLEMDRTNQKRVKKSDVINISTQPFKSFQCEQAGCCKLYISREFLCKHIENEHPYKITTNIDDSLTSGTSAIEPVIYQSLDSIVREPFIPTRALNQTNRVIKNNDVLEMNEAIQKQEQQFVNTFPESCNQENSDQLEINGTIQKQVEVVKIAIQSLKQFQCEQAGCGKFYISPEFLCKHIENEHPYKITINVDDSLTSAIKPAIDQSLDPIENGQFITSAALNQNNRLTTNNDASEIIGTIQKQVSKIVDNFPESRSQVEVHKNKLQAFKSSNKNVPSIDSTASQSPHLSLTPQSTQHVSIDSICENKPSMFEDSLISHETPLTTTIDPVIEVQSYDPIKNGLFILTGAPLFDQQLPMLTLTPMNDNSFVLDKAIKPKDVTLQIIESDQQIKPQLSPFEPTNDSCLQVKLRYPVASTSTPLSSSLHSISHISHSSPSSSSIDSPMDRPFKNEKEGCQSFNRKCHLTKHNKVYQCNFIGCKTVCKKTRTLSLPFVDKHSGKSKKTFQCKESHKYLNRKSSLNKHHRMVHSVRKFPSTIEKSDKVYKSKTALMNNSNRSLELASRHSCGVNGCDMWFDTRKIVQNHIELEHSDIIIRDEKNKVIGYIAGAIGSLVKNETTSKQEHQIADVSVESLNKVEALKSGSQTCAFFNVNVESRGSIASTSTFSSPSLHSTSIVSHDSPESSSINSLISLETPHTPIIKPVMEVQSRDSINTGLFNTTGAQMLNQHNEQLDMLTLMPKDDCSLALINQIEETRDNSFVSNGTSTRILDNNPDWLPQLIHPNASNVKIISNDSLTRSLIHSIVAPLTTTSDPFIEQSINSIERGLFTTVAPVLCQYDELLPSILHDQQKQQCQKQPSSSFWLQPSGYDQYNKVSINSDIQTKIVDNLIIFNHDLVSQSENVPIQSLDSIESGSFSNGAPILKQLIEHQPTINDDVLNVQSLRTETLAHILQQSNLPNHQYLSNASITNNSNDQPIESNGTLQISELSSTNSDHISSKPFKLIKCVQKGCGTWHCSRVDLRKHFEKEHLLKSSDQIIGNNNTIEKTKRTTKKGKERSLNSKHIPHDLWLHCPIEDCDRAYEHPALKHHLDKKHDNSSKSMSSTGKIKFKCNQIKCAKSYTSIKRLKNHIEKEHSDDIVINQELKVESSNEHYKCDVCDLVFNNQSSLTRHVPIHWGTFRCLRLGCGKFFSSRATMWTHFKRHSTIPINEIDNLPNVTVLRICKRNKHDSTTSPSESVTNSFASNVLETDSIASSDELSTESFPQDPATSHSICISHHSGSKSSFFVNGQSDMRHTNELFDPIASKSFLQLTSLCSHESHSSSSINSSIDKPFKCNHEGCHKSFDKIRGLKLHIRLVHSMSQTHSCYVNRYDKPFSSPKLFRDKTVDPERTIQKLMNKHHKQASMLMTNNGIKCELPGCGRMFVRSKDLKNHLKDHHLLPSKNESNLDTSNHDKMPLDDTIGQPFSPTGSFNKELLPLLPLNDSYKRNDQMDLTETINGQEIASESLIATHNTCQTPLSDDDVSIDMEFVSSLIDLNDDSESQNGNENIQSLDPIKTNSLTIEAPILEQYSDLTPSQLSSLTVLTDLPYRCIWSNCNKAFVHKHDLMEHLREHFKLSKYKTSTSILTPSSTIKPLSHFYNSLSNPSFSHQREGEEKDQKVQTAPKSVQFYCTWNGCDKVFTRRAHLWEHQIIHSRHF